MVFYIPMLDLVEGRHSVLSTSSTFYIVALDCRDCPSIGTFRLVIVWCFQFFGIVQTNDSGHCLLAGTIQTNDLGSCPLFGNDLNIVERSLSTKCNSRNNWFGVTYMNSNCWNECIIDWGDGTWIRTAETNALGQSPLIGIVCTTGFGRELLIGVVRTIEF